MLVLVLAVTGIFNLLIALVILLLIFWLAYFIINRLAPEPMRGILTTILIVLAVLVIIYWLLSLIGGKLPGF